MNKYKKTFSECFTSLTKDEINRSFDIVMDSENRIPMCSEFRNKVNGCLKDKGYSKKQIDDIMDMYTAAYSAGFTTGAVLYSFDCDVEKTNTLFNF